MQHKTVLGFAMLAAIVCGSSANAASLIVVEARGIALKPGASLDASKPLLLRQGQHVTLISENGATLQLDGPYNQPPSAGGQGRSIGATLAALGTEHNARTGEAGVTRGIAPNTLPDPWLIDVSHNGNVCLRENQRPVFWRPDPSSRQALVVMPDDRSWKSEGIWPAGISRLSVTTNVPMHGGATYVVKYNGSEYDLTVNAVPASLPNDQVRAAWMAQKGCEAQAEALIRSRP